MIFTSDLDAFLKSIGAGCLIPVKEEAKNTLQNHGNYDQWIKLLKQLPETQPSSVNLNQPVVTIGNKECLNKTESDILLSVLKSFHPWRKGPFNLFGNQIDAEWQSDFKWERLEKHLGSIKNMKILDIGCGNGYYGWRMLGAGASAVLGIEPFLLSGIQFLAFKKYLSAYPFQILPIGVEKMPSNLNIFDKVFSMGVFYHRRSPMDHLLQLKSFLREGAELVLETLVINGPAGEALVPNDRYAKMRNVWFIPTPGTLESWLKKAGYIDIRCVDITRISAKEQRQTDWMKWESLPDFLDPQDISRTIEGHPAPVRAIFLARIP